MAKTVRVLGYILLWLGGAVIFFGWGATLYLQGFWKLAEIIHPFNLTNWIVNMAILAPGILLLQWASKLDQSN